jgi:hypothetical protein
VRIPMRLPVWATSVGLAGLLAFQGCSAAAPSTGSSSTGTAPTRGAGGTPTPTIQPIATPAPTATPGFTLTGAMSTPRSDHTATLLLDGRVLMVGGASAGSDLASAEIYAPATGKFTRTGSLSKTRVHHTATLLLDGRVLVVGGRLGLAEAGFPALATAELFDPNTGTFSPTGSMSVGRDGHSATLLEDGRVLIAGGHGPDFDWGRSGALIHLASAELYNPTTGTFTPTGSMSISRAAHTATLLEDGRVLIAGGHTLDGKLTNGGWDYTASSAELYDPAAGTFTPTGSMGSPREHATATRLADGRVLLVGGRIIPRDPSAIEVVVQSAETYDAQTGEFIATGSMFHMRNDHTATLLANGLVLVAGGTGAPLYDYAELFDPATGQFVSTVQMPTMRSGHTATLLKDGRVLIAGGSNQVSAELYQP